jgi:hypothetical protein
LNRSGESGTLVSFLILEEMVSGFSAIRIILAIDLSYIAFMMLRHIPSIHGFLKVFIMK